MTGGGGVVVRTVLDTGAGKAGAADQGLRIIRVELRDRVPPDVVEAAAATYEQERHRLRACRHAVDTVEKALRGERWVPRL